MFFFLKGKYKRFQWKCSEGKMVILEHFFSPAPRDTLSCTLKNLSCTDQSQWMPGLLLGTVTFLLMLGGTNSLGGGVRVSRALLPDWGTVLTSGAGISPMNRAQTLLWLMNPPHFPDALEGQFQRPWSLFYSLCICSCCTELSSPCVHHFSLSWHHIPLSLPTHMSLAGIFAPSLQHSSSPAAFVCLQQVATEPEKCISCLTWFHPGVKRCSGSGSAPPFLTMWGEAEGFSSLHQFASFKSIKRDPEQQDRSGEEIDRANHGESWAD